MAPGEGGGEVPSKLREVEDESADRQMLLTTLTTEHFTLQGARSRTIG